VTTEGREEEEEVGSRESLGLGLEFWCFGVGLVVRVRVRRK
jgi:hypothetical protein